MKDLEHELQVMDSIWEQVKTLEIDAFDRVLCWLVSKLKEKKVHLKELGE